jgi:peptide/nickel transport system permease protein
MAGHNLTAISTGSPDEAATNAMSRLGLWKTLLRRPVFIACVGYLAIVAIIAIVAPLVLPNVDHQGVGDLLHVRQGPSASHLLGTDSLGRDVLQRLLVGARITMIGVVVATAAAILIGVPIGLWAGYSGGRVDRAASWLTDLSFSIPGLVIILVVLSVVPHSLAAAMFTLGALGAPGVARIVRGATLPVREELYVSAAWVSGLSHSYITRRHILPRIGGVVVVQAALTAAGAVWITAGLGYLGLLDSSTASWGGMIQDGIGSLQLQPWLIWPPGFAIGTVVLAFTLLGDCVRDVSAARWGVAGNSKPPTHKRTRGPVVARAPISEGKPRLVDSGRIGGAMLEVHGLSIALSSPTGHVGVVDDVNFAISEGEVVGLVGESGCGKTLTAMAILGLLPSVAVVSGGEIRYNGVDLVTASRKRMRRVRGKEIAFISQEPIVSFTPTLRIGTQIAEVVRRHRGVTRREARNLMIELLNDVQLPDAAAVAASYPHELSGGMAQRASIARALAGEPKLLIADEPTTALDVTIQAEILDLLRDLRTRRHMAIVAITHDWGVIADLCDRALVMYSGQIVEEASTDDLCREPMHPYTAVLLDADPHLARNGDSLPVIPGSVPNPGGWPSGCRFHPRCGFAQADCISTNVELSVPSPGRTSRCLHYDRLHERRTSSLSHIDAR